MSIQSPNPDGKSSFFDSLKNKTDQIANYINKGEQLGGKPVSRDASSYEKTKRMSLFPKAIFKKDASGMDLSPLKKIANGVFFGFNIVFPPFLGAHALTVAVMKHMSKTDFNEKLNSKATLEKSLSANVNKEIDLEIKIKKLDDSHSSINKIESLRSQLIAVKKQTYEIQKQLDLVNGKLNIPFHEREKEDFKIKKMAIDLNKFPYALSEDSWNELESGLVNELNASHKNNMEIIVRHNIDPRDNIWGELEDKLSKDPEKSHKNSIYLALSEVIEDYKYKVAENNKLIDECISQGGSRNSLPKGDREPFISREFAKHLNLKNKERLRSKIEILDLENEKLKHKIDFYTVEKNNLVHNGSENTQTTLEKLKAIDNSEKNYSNNLQSKTQLQAELKPLLKNQLLLKIRTETAEKFLKAIEKDIVKDPNNVELKQSFQSLNESLRGFQGELAFANDQIDQFRRKIKDYDNLLSTSTLVRNKESLLEQREIYNEALNEPFYEEIKIELRDKRDNLFTIFLNKQDREIAIYQNIREMRSDKSIQTSENTLLDSFKHLSDTQITILISDHIKAKEEIIALRRLDNHKPLKGDNILDNYSFTDFNLPENPPLKDNQEI